MQYVAAGIRRKSAPKEGSGRSEFYGMGVHGRTVRARKDKGRLLQAQGNYERLVKERTETASAH
jgi:hypothetical protein